LPSGDLPSRFDERGDQVPPEPGEERPRFPERRTRFVGDQETERVADAVGRYGEVGCRQG
jgi:hypothetical protein